MLRTPTFNQTDHASFTYKSYTNLGNRPYPLLARRTYSHPAAHEATRFGDLQIGSVPLNLIRSFTYG